MVDKAPPAEVGFTPEQKSELATMIVEAVKGGAPPLKDPDEKPIPSKAEMDAMTERQRESYFEDLVGRALDKLQGKQKLDGLEADVTKLKMGQTKVPEHPPTVLNKIGRFLWGATE